jgi:hypothetical protein
LHWSDTGSSFSSSIPEHPFVVAALLYTFPSGCCVVV